MEPHQTYKKTEPPKSKIKIKYLS